MAIQDDFTIDVVGKKITFSTPFVDDRPPSIYTTNDLYKFLQDTFDEPSFFQYSIPMSAQTPTQYTLINGWFIDDESMKALYGGSIQTSGWTYVASPPEGITGLRWTDGSADAPIPGDVGVVLTGGTSGATGLLLAVDTARQVAWVRNSSGVNFDPNEGVTGTGIDLTTETNSGVSNGESIWSNLFSVGSLQTETEIYIGQEDDYMGGTAFHDADANSTFERRIEKINEWWDSDVDFTNSPNLLGGLGHFDVLVKTQESGQTIDSQNLAIFARQFSKVFSHFELVGGVGNFVVPFSSGASDLNAQDGPYTCTFSGRAGTDMAVGDVLENGSTSPSGRLRAVVTAVDDGNAATGTIEFFLIGDTEGDKTLIQLGNGDNLLTRGSSTNDFETSSVPSTTGPGLTDPGAGVVTITFDDAQVDVDENGTPEQYACTIDCVGNPLADVYKRVMFLTARGNQDGTVAGVQDELLPSGRTQTDATNEASEFYRGVGDIVITWSARAGTGILENELVKGSISNAIGVVVSATEEASGADAIGVLTQVKGTFQSGDVVSQIDDGSTDTVTLDAAGTSIVANTAAPFGTFAGGRWFVAQGVVLINVPTSDANNWETVDLPGGVVIPPTVRTLTFAGLAVNDRAALLEVSAAGTDLISNALNGVGGAGAAIGAATIPLDSSVALDVPSTGWIRIVDTSLAATGDEYRFAYSAVSGTTVTLDQGAWSTGTATATDATPTSRLVDSGAFTAFGSAGEPRIGMHIRNTTTGGLAIILRKIDNDTIETTVLSTGQWSNTDTWEMNAPVIALVDADTVYFPFIDDVAISSTISKNIKYVGDTPCIARARFSDPDVGGTRILPFVQKNITITDADLTITAIRTTDSIAS